MYQNSHFNTQQKQLTTARPVETELSRYPQQPNQPQTSNSMVQPPLSPATASPARRRCSATCVLVTIVTIILVAFAILIPVAIKLSRPKDYDGKITKAAAYYSCASNVYSSWCWLYDGYHTDFWYNIQNTGRKNAYFSMNIWINSSFEARDWEFILRGATEHKKIKDVFEQQRAGSYELRLKVHPSGKNDDGKVVDKRTVSSISFW
eukprot:TRINITY_DN6024_c0_g1_i2.p1 TRINITY_DN6024_c0_g1~~TRINITY_DN6024_c0_g1_i2.p1  ORF type:complete len:206 (-),score=6.10 TRINITY_DN6024_c0_g1_i2:312-929(-)